MRTLLFSGNTAWGMYNFRASLLKHFIMQGDRVVVVSPYDMNFSPKLQKLGCQIVNLSLEAKGANPFSELRLFLAYRRIIKQVKPNYCFFYTIKPNIYGSLAAQSLNVPYVPITTGLGYTFMKKNLVAKAAHYLYKFAFRHTPQVWFLNNDDKEEFLRTGLIHPEQAYVLQGGEGLDLTRFKGKKHLYSDAQDAPVDDYHQSNIRFLLSARMLYDKGVKEFVEAAHILRAKYPNAQFCLLGPMGVANPAAITEDQMQEWLEDGNVQYLGVTNDVIPFLQTADCVVLPSYREGISFTLLEGSAMGLPVVTTNTIGCRDVVDDGITGWLCHPKDVPSLVFTMEKVLLMSPEARKKMGEAGRKKIEKEFSVCRVIKQYERLLNEKH